MWCNSDYKWEDVFLGESLGIEQNRRERLVKKYEEKFENISVAIHEALSLSYSAKKLSRYDCKPVLTEDQKNKVLTLLEDAEKFFRTDRWLLKKIEKNQEEDTLKFFDYVVAPGVWKILCDEDRAFAYGYAFYYHQFNEEIEESKIVTSFLAAHCLKCADESVMVLNKSYRKEGEASFVSRLFSPVLRVKEAPKIIGSQSLVSGEYIERAFSEELNEEEDLQEGALPRGLEIENKPEIDKRICIALFPTPVPFPQKNAAAPLSPPLSLSGSEIEESDEDGFFKDEELSNVVESEDRKSTET